MPMILESQTARELAAKSHEARRRNKELREQAEREEQSKPQFVPQIAEPLPADSKHEELTRTLKQIEELNTQLDQCDDFKAWDALTRAKERLFRIWAHLAGIPGPGNLKPSNKPQSQRRPMPEPVPCGPEPTISSGPAPASEPSSPKSLEPQQ